MRIRRRALRISPHTGREMIELHGWVTTADADTHDWLAVALRQEGERGVRAEDEAGEFLGEWLISWNAYGESAGGVHTYTLILRECEDLDLDVLLVGDAELYPYEYREEAFGEGVAIWAKLVGTEDDVRQLRRMMQTRRPLPVVRRGIQDQARQMRVGVAEWSEFEDRIKYRLVLVEESIDTSAHPALTRVERENSRAALGFYMNFAEQLVELLIRKGIATPEEIEAVRTEAAELPVVVRHDFWHILRDVDEL